jgi:hypothetical protein
MHHQTIRVLGSAMATSTLCAFTISGIACALDPFLEMRPDGGPRCMIQTIGILDNRPGKERPQLFPATLIYQALLCGLLHSREKGIPEFFILIGGPVDGEAPPVMAGILHQLCNFAIGVARWRSKKVNGDGRPSVAFTLVAVVKRKLRVILM